MRRRFKLLKQTGDVADLDGLDLTGVSDGDLLQYNVSTETFVPVAPTSLTLGTGQIDGLLEFTQDTAAEMIDDGTGLTWTYSDAAGTLQGDVSLTPFSTTDLSEGSNLYYTQGRFDIAFAAKSTSNLTEGSNLYFTDGRAQAAIGNDFVTNAKLANMADSTIKGRTAGAGTGDPVDLTPAQVATIVAASVATALNITSNVYTPTLTNVSNVGSSTAFQCQYLRVGSTVVVSGAVSVDPTTITTDTIVGISLPVASNFGSAVDCAGTAACFDVQQTAAIFADTVNDRASLRFLSSDTSARNFYFTFAYRVI